MKYGKAFGPLEELGWFKVRPIIVIFFYSVLFGKQWLNRLKIENCLKIKAIDLDLYLKGQCVGEEKGTIVCRVQQRHVSSRTYKDYINYLYHPHQVAGHFTYQKNICIFFSFDMLLGIVTIVLESVVWNYN